MPSKEAVGVGAVRVICSHCRSPSQHCTPCACAMHSKAGVLSLHVVPYLLLLPARDKTDWRDSRRLVEAVIEQVWECYGIGGVIANDDGARASTTTFRLSLPLLSLGSERQDRRGNEERRIHSDEGD